MKSRIKYTFLKDFNRPAGSQFPEKMKHIPAGSSYNGWYEFAAATRISSDLVFYLIQAGVIRKEIIK